MTDNTTEPPQYPVIHGMTWVPGTTEEMVDTFPRLLSRQDDIYIASYPKSGTTWTQEIVWQIIHNGKVDYRPLHVRMPWIDGMPYDTAENPYPVTSAGMMEKMFESFPTPRVFKTHLPYDLVPKAHGQAYKARYIYVIRNPKDAAVSLYEFMSSMPNPPKLNWNEFCELFFQGKVFYGMWFDHVLGWWKHKDDPNILILKYEEMKKDLPGAIHKIATFIGKELPPEILERILNQTSFDAMKKEGNANFSFLREFKGDVVRKGKVGNWKEYFTEDQSKRFDRLLEEKFAGLGLKLEF